MGKGGASELPDDLRERIERHPWDLTLPRLLAHARARIRERFWSGVLSGPIPGGIQAEDMVNMAVEKLMGRQRRWDPVRQPDLEDYLKGVIDSEINHLAEGWENRHVRPEAVFPGAEGEKGVLDGIPEEMAGVEERMAERQEHGRAEAFAAGFLASLADEPLLQRVAECIVDGLGKPAEIAARLGIGADEIYRVRKRLQRRLEDYYEHWRKSGKPGRGGDMPWG
ncbi:MAG: hypothetical protein AAB152_10980 [Candidatus Coatesbacteria bacterium]